jgi:glycerophosphoryl diester phosphodiesterase
MFLYPIIIIGHRGACGYVPENTLSSFAKAIECNVDVIELDVRRCASGELVVFHDAKVDRITDGYGLVATKTIHELKQLTVLGTECISTLEEVLDFIDHRVKVYIELKDFGVIEDVLVIIDFYIQHKQWNYGDFLIASFDHTQLRHIKGGNKAITVVALMYGIPVSFGACASEINADIVSLDSEFITPQFVDDIHNRNMLVYVYTVNSKQELSRLSSCNIDGIVTDFPDLIRNLSF